MSATTVRIAGSEYNPVHQALEIYVSGCTRQCPGCHNPETWDFDKGTPWETWVSLNSVKLQAGLLKHIWILGGDLLCQKDMDEVLRLIKFLGSFGLKLWLWTGADPKEVPRELWPYFAYIKTGPYREGGTSVYYSYELDAPRLKLVSNNQQLWMILNGNPFALRKGQKEEE